MLSIKFVSQLLYLGRFIRKSAKKKTQQQQKFSLVLVNKCADQGH